MTIDSVVKLINAIANFFGVIIWPLVWLTLAIRFGPTIGSFIANLSEFSLKGAGFEASLKRKQVEVAASISAAAASHGNYVTPEDVASVLAQVVSPNVLAKTKNAAILWVDDEPDNNIYERQAFEAMGIQLFLAHSTEEATALIRNRDFDLIISDMGREGDSRAGYTLLEKLRSASNYTPFFIYSSSREPEHIKEAIHRGAVGCTNRADELFSRTLSILSGRKATEKN